jgi:hypothetical protein
MTDSSFFRRNHSDRFLAEALPDGSIAIFDSQTETVHSLNPAAALVLEACGEPATLDYVAVVLRRCTGCGDPGETALHVLQRLEAAELVMRTDSPAPLMPPSHPSRRDLLKKAAMGSAVLLALPAMLTLTGAEQRLYAQTAGSGITTTPGP